MLHTDRSRGEDTTREETNEGELNIVCALRYRGSRNGVISSQNWDGQGNIRSVGLVSWTAWQ